MSYQDGNPDQFYYRYDYDADNRLTAAWSSPLANIVPYGGSTLNPAYQKRDAGYQYYLHGPLARMELGDTSAKVQGVDYAYTLQGWLKGVNSQDINGSDDIGQDGINSTAVARDAYGYSLGYYHNDYIPIGGDNSPAFVRQYRQNTGDITGQSLYNGNISTATQSISSITSGNPVGYTYHYDQLNRIKDVRQHTGIGRWSADNISPYFREDFSYDGNGNILTVNRVGADTSLTDSLAYIYNRDSNNKLTDNKLNYLNGIGNASSFGRPQSPNNYTYDPIRNLTTDVQSNIDSIYWSVYGKILEIDKPDTTITFTYNPAGQRATKTVSGITTYYVRDAQGNTMAVYQTQKSGTYWTEQHLYGSSRIGMWIPGVDLKSKTGTRTFELDNHLGNTMATVSDVRIPHYLPDSTTIDYYLPTVITSNDYYAFGGLQKGRSYLNAGVPYRYGFNGKEDDNEVKGVGNQQDYGMRIYDPRVGRFLSTDPLAKSYPELSPYQFASNRPIDGIDMDGLEYVGTKQVDGDPPVFVQTVFAVNDFLANTYSSAMSLVSPSTQGGVIRNILRNNGIEAPGLTNKELAAQFDVRMITGGTVENPQRGWTVLPRGSALEQAGNFALGAVSAIAVYSTIKNGGGGPLLEGASGSTGAVEIADMIRALQISKRGGEISSELMDLAKNKPLRTDEAEAMAILEETIGGKVSQSTHPGADANILGNQSISHMGTGGRSIAVMDLEHG